MKVKPEHRGLLIFGMIALVMCVAAIAAYLATGPMGIEERFNAATGIATGSGNDTAGEKTGFFIEGNTILYIVVLAALAAGCAVIYRHYRI